MNCKVCGQYLSGRHYFYGGEFYCSQQCITLGQTALYKEQMINKIVSDNQNLGGTLEKINPNSRYHKGKNR